MKNRYFFGMLLTLTTCIVTAQKYSDSNQTEKTTEWNGHAISSSKTFFENIEGINEFSILSKSFRNETINDKLNGEEMITIFAPMDRSFLDLPEKTRDSIINFSNGAFLNSIIKFTTVPGRIDLHSLKKAIEVNKGIAYFSTLDGEKLGVKEVNGGLVIFDSMNNTAKIIASDFYHKNGFFHMIEGIVFPE